MIKYGIPLIVGLIAVCSVCLCAEQYRQVTLKHVRFIPDTTGNPLTCYAPDGTLYIAGAQGIWSLRLTDAGKMQVDMAKWPSSLDIYEGPQGPGLLSFHWGKNGLVLGSQRLKAEVDINYWGDDNERVAEVVFSKLNNTVVLRQLPLPEEVRVIGSQRLVGDKIATYEPKDDVILYYDEQKVCGSSGELDAATGLSLSVMLVSDAPEVDCRNVWLLPIAGDRLVGLDQFSGRMYLIQHDLTIEDVLAPSEHIAGAVQESRETWRPYLWSPSAFGSQVCQVLPDMRGGLVLAVWNVGEDSVSFSDIPLKLKGNVFHCAVALKSHSEGAIVAAAKGGLRVYEFQLHPEE